MLRRQSDVSCLLPAIKLKPNWWIKNTNEEIQVISIKIHFGLLSSMMPGHHHNQMDINLLSVLIYCTDYVLSYNYEIDQLYVWRCLK